jgi:hypothetical protein
MSIHARIAVALLALPSLPAVAGEPRPSGGVGQAAPAETAHAETCPHGVKKSLCVRCNPRLAPVFRAKGDWCAEHERAESQCVLCHPELAKKGIK